MQTLPVLDKSFINPCWYEVLPKHFTYTGNYYASCDFKNSSRPRNQIRASFQRMDKVFAKRHEAGNLLWIEYYILKLTYFV